MDDVLPPHFKLEDSLHGTLDPKTAATWTEESVQKWVSNFGRIFERFVPNFTYVNGETLLTQPLDSLFSDLAIPPAARPRFSMEIKKLRLTIDTAVAPAPSVTAAAVTPTQPSVTAAAATMATKMMATINTAVAPAPSGTTAAVTATTTISSTKTAPLKPLRLLKRLGPLCKPNEPGNLSSTKVSTTVLSKVLSKPLVASLQVSPNKSNESVFPPADSYRWRDYSFTLLRPLGKGKKSLVFEAKCPGIANTACLKMEPVDDCEKLINEARLLPKLEDCNGVPRVIFLGETIFCGSRWCILITDKVGACSLAAVVSPSNERLKTLANETIDILRQIHTKNVTHNNIKPDRFHFDQNGKLFLIGFGASIYSNDFSISTISTGSALSASAPVLPPRFIDSQIAVSSRTLGKNTLRNSSESFFRAKSPSRVAHSPKQNDFARLWFSLTSLVQPLPSWDKPGTELFAKLREKSTLRPVALKKKFPDLAELFIPLCPGFD